MPSLRVRKSHFHCFSSFQKRHSGAQNENLRPVLKSGLWRGNVVRNLLTFGHWKVFFSFYIGLFLILGTWENSSFTKEEGLHHKMYKTKLDHCSGVVPNLIVEIETFNFVCLFVCTSHFANFAKGKWSNHDSKSCSEIRTVTWSVIWLCKLQFTILIFFNPL